MPGAHKAHTKECAQAEEDMKEQPLSESADDRLARVDQDVCEQRRMIKELVTAQREASVPFLRQWLPAWRAQALHLGGGGKRIRCIRRRMLDSKR
jgi:hypothetical protein